MLFHNDIRGEREAKRDIATDVNASMLFLVPAALCKPSPECETVGAATDHSVGVGAQDLRSTKRFVKVMLSFQRQVPGLAQWVYQHQGNNRCDSNRGVS